MGPRGFSVLSAYESDERLSPQQILNSLYNEVRVGVAEGWEIQLEKNFFYHNFGGTQFDYWEIGGTTLGPKTEILRGGPDIPAFSAMPYVTFGDSSKSPPPGGRYGGILFLSDTLGIFKTDLNIKAEASAASPLYGFYAGARGPLYGRDLEFFFNLRGDFCPRNAPMNELQGGLRLNYFDPLRVAFRYDYHLKDMRLDNDWTVALGYTGRF